MDDNRTEGSMDTMVEPKRRRFTIAEYHRMIEAGIFREKERAELIEGEIIEMSPTGRLHAGTVDRVTAVFFRRLGDRASVRVGGPILFTDLVSEPQPDVTLLVPRPDSYSGGHPEPADILLVVEVMDASVAYDRGVKRPLYARAGVVEVWLANVNTRRIEGYRRPSPEGYVESRVFQEDDLLSIQAFPDVTFTVRELLG
jgi:Uma2 family endonuclease